MLSPLRACLVFASLAALTIGCQNRSELASASRSSIAPTAGPTAAAAPPSIPAAASPSPSQPTMVSALAEQTLDTDVGPAPLPAGDAPVLTTHDRRKSKVRTVSDERLPKWVPVRGRLTVVDSSDLAENLGLVPKGTTKSTDERISVADKLAEESAARAKSDPIVQGVSFSYAKPGRFRSRR